MFWGFSARCVDPRDLAEWRSDVEPDVIEHDDFMPDYASRLERHEVTDYAPGVRESYTALDLGADDLPRSAHRAEKSKIAIALVNLHKTITMEDFNAALAYVRYQAKIRRVFQAAKRTTDSRQKPTRWCAVRSAKRTPGSPKLGSHWRSGGSTSDGWHNGTSGHCGPYRWASRGRSRRYTSQATCRSGWRRTKRAGRRSTGSIRGRGISEADAGAVKRMKTETRQNLPTPDTQTFVGRVGSVSYVCVDGCS